MGKELSSTYNSVNNFRVYNESQQESNQNHDQMQNIQRAIENWQEVSLVYMYVYDIATERITKRTKTASRERAHLMWT